MSRFEWHDFIDLACHILDNHELDSSFFRSKEESVWRTVISRAYYGIFKQVEDFLKNNGLIDIHTTSHKKIIDYFDNIDFQFFQQLDRLKGLRHIADYKKNQFISKRDAENAARLAQSLTSHFKILTSKLLNVGHS